MRLARKLTAALVLGILLVMAAYAYLQLRQEIVLSTADLRRTRHLGLAWLGTMEAVWQQEGPARAIELMHRADARAPDVELRLWALDEAVAGLQRPPLSAVQLERLRAGKLVREERTDDAGRPWRHIYGALKVNESHPAAIELMEPLTPEQSFIHMSHLALALATITVVVVCSFIAIGIQYWFVGRPLELLREKTRRAGDGDFSGPLVFRQRDEIGDLAQDVNAMCARIAEAHQRLAVETAARITALEQLRHTDRLATVGQLAAGVAHELGTPLNVVSARAELIGSTDLSRRDVIANARIIVEQADRMTEIIQQLLDFSRRRGAKPSLADLRPVVSGALDLLSSVADKARVQLRYDAPAQAMLARVDQNQVQQAVTNVVLNGIQAMPNGGQLTVTVTPRRTRPPQDPQGTERECVVIQVDDNGKGMGPEQIAHIFEPFFTTKQVGEGTGLGLAVAHGIVTEHGGWITVDSEVGRGSRFSIVLPQPAGGHEVAVA